MSKFEILCVTMHQTDFSKIEEMNIHSDVVFANQADKTTYEELEFDGHKAKMITTQTRGVGKNRNLAQVYASGEICLYADDDVIYSDDAEERILAEFDAHSDADVIIFHLESEDPARRQRKYTKTKKWHPWEKMPWGCVRVAFRLDAVKKKNIWFTTLFGGGCVFPSGEDSMWLSDAKRRGLTFYVSKETIGKLPKSESTWFTGADERFYYGKGAFYQAVHPNTIGLWMLYFAWRTSNMAKIPFAERIRWMKKGRAGYRTMTSFEEATKSE